MTDTGSKFCPKNREKISNGRALATGIAWFHATLVLVVVLLYKYS